MECLLVDALAPLGFATGGLISFLDRPMAVDLRPARPVAGSGRSDIGCSPGIGAVAQDWISGVLIENTKTVVGDVTTGSFDSALYCWIPASIACLLLACFAWSKKPGERVS